MRRLFLLLLFSPLLALEYEPWFPPLGEFHAIALYDYYKNTQQEEGTSHFLRGDLQLSPFPYWDGQVELDFIDASNTSFTLGAAELLLRYQWRGNVVCEPWSFVTGLSWTLLREPWLHNINAYATSYFNIGINACAGHIRYLRNSILWSERFWLYAEYLIYNSSGSDVLRLLATFDRRLFPRFFGKIDIEYLTSFGNKNVFPDPFYGYDQSKFFAANLALKGVYETRFYGLFEFGGFYNFAAQNSPKNYWGLHAKINYPFGL